MKKALIFDVQRFSVHDGPGIRTLMFFKGCTLACAWCSNPEGICVKPELKQNKRLCVGCGQCVRNCPNGAIHHGPESIVIDRVRCKKCGVCVDHCYTQALTWWGRECEVMELLDQARRDMPFYATSGGGVTLGGGEPMLQNEQAVTLLRLCKEQGINTAIETAGNYPWEYLWNAAPYCDTIHFDLKAWGEKAYQEWAKVGTVQVVANLRNLDQWIAEQLHPPRLVVRLPLLPGENFTLADFEELAGFLGGFQSLTAVEILPFHNLGAPKYEQLGKPYSLKDRGNLRAGDVDAYKKILADKGLPVTVCDF